VEGVLVIQVLYNKFTRYKMWSQFSKLQSCTTARHIYSTYSTRNYLFRRCRYYYSNN